MSLTAMLGPLIMNNLFSFFTSPNRAVYFPGVAFFMGAIFVFSALIISKLAFEQANTR
jgi:DHA1 family tetracycline resistance protein-like MFS transporter